MDTAPLASRGPGSQGSASRSQAPERWVTAGLSAGHVVQALSMCHLMSLCGAARGREEGTQSCWTTGSERLALDRQSCGLRRALGCAVQTHRQLLGGHPADGVAAGAAAESAEREAGLAFAQGFSSRLLPRGSIPVLGTASPVWRSLGVPGYRHRGGPGGYRHRGGPGVDKHLQICLLAAGGSLCATCDFVPLHDLARRQGAASPGVP